METSALTEILPIQLLRIRPITVISNSLISFNSIYKLEHSPLMNLVINPLSEEIQSQPTPDNLIYKGYVSFAASIYVNFRLIPIKTVHFSSGPTR